MMVQKIVFWLSIIGVALFVLLRVILPFWMAILWSTAVVGWVGCVLLWLYATHQIHWLEDKIIRCSQCRHAVDLAFLDGQPAWERNCPYCGYALSEHTRISRGKK